jgi:hypothetical protein
MKWKLGWSERILRPPSWELREAHPSPFYLRMRQFACTFDQGWEITCDKEATRLSPQHV